MEGRCGAMMLETFLVDDGLERGSETLETTCT